MKKLLLILLFIVSIVSYSYAGMVIGSWYGGGGAIECAPVSEGALVFASWSKPCAAVTFIPSISVTITGITAHLSRGDGSPTTTLTACIHNDNGGVPGSEITCSDAFSSSNIGTSSSDISFTGSISASVTATTPYWLLLKISELEGISTIWHKGAADECDGKGNLTATYQAYNNDTVGCGGDWTGDSDGSYIFKLTY